MRARHWKGPPPYWAPCGVKSWPTGLPEADDGADRDGDRNRDQNPEEGHEKDGQGEGLSNFANPEDLAPLSAIPLAYEHHAIVSTCRSSHCPARPRQMSRSLQRLIDDIAVIDEPRDKSDRPHQRKAAADLIDLNGA